MYVCNEKRVKDLSRYITKRAITAASEYEKVLNLKYREIQTKTTLGYHATPTSFGQGANIRNSSTLPVSGERACKPV